MKPLDLSDQKTRFIALAGLLTFGLAAGIELASWMKSGNRKLLPGAEKPQVFLPPKVAKPVEGLAYDDLLGMLAKHKDEITAQQWAEAFMTEPDLSGAWEKVKEDGDMPEFVRRVKQSAAYEKLFRGPAFEKMASKIGASAGSSAFAAVFGASLPGTQAASAGPLPEVPARVSSGGPIRAGKVTAPSVGAAPPIQGPGTQPGAGAQKVSDGAPPAAGAPNISSGAPAPSGSKAHDVAASLASVPEAGAGGTGGGAKPEATPPCPMAEVCTENTKGTCDPSQAPGAFADARRQGCACAMDDLSGILQADGNGPLLAALMGGGGLTPLLQRVDSIMRRNALTSGRCNGFKKFTSPDQRRDAGKREGTIWKAELRRQLKVFAQKNGVEFAEPGS